MALADGDLCILIRTASGNLAALPVSTPSDESYCLLARTSDGAKVAVSLSTVVEEDALGILARASDGKLVMLTSQPGIIDLGQTYSKAYGLYTDLAGTTRVPVGNTFYTPFSDGDCGSCPACDAGKRAIFYTSDSDGFHNFERPVIAGSTDVHLRIDNDLSKAASSVETNYERGTNYYDIQVDDGVSGVLISQEDVDGILKRINKPIDGITTCSTNAFRYISVIDYLARRIRLDSIVAPVITFSGITGDAAFLNGAHTLGLANSLILGADAVDGWVFKTSHSKVGIVDPVFASRTWQIFFRLPRRSDPTVDGYEYTSGGTCLVLQTVPFLTTQWSFNWDYSEPRDIDDSSWSFFDLNFVTQTARPEFANASFTITY